MARKNSYTYESSILGWKCAIPGNCPALTRMRVCYECGGFGNTWVIDELPHIFSVGPWSKQCLKCQNIDLAKYTKIILSIIITTDTRSQNPDIVPCNRWFIGDYCATYISKLLFYCPKKSFYWVLRLDKTFMDRMLILNHNCWFT